MLGKVVFLHGASIHTTAYSRNPYINIQLPHVCTYKHIYIATYIKLQTYIHNTNLTHTTKNTNLGLHASKNPNHRKMITTVKLNWHYQHYCTLKLLTLARNQLLCFIYRQIITASNWSCTSLYPWYFCLIIVMGKQ